MHKSNTYILITLVIGLSLIFQWQMNKMDRKLTCIYTQLNTLPSFILPELRADLGTLQKQIELVESACDTSYIFSGIRK